MQVNCLVLFSGGLDSIIACKLLQGQGLGVTALMFITPFFGYRHRGRAAREQERIRADYGIDARIIDISRDYLKMVADPPHGYGRYMNPCIDCKILMVKKAMELLGRFDASFVASGEVLGQRPMSQRKDTLRVIERESGAAGRLLRPLSALHLPETVPERQGLVDRSRLLGLSGRGRKAQMALAASFGITNYPTPAGGCVLADPILSARFKRIFAFRSGFDINDCLLAQVGRHFRLPDGSWLVVGRNQVENQRIDSLLSAGDIRLEMRSLAGPTALWRPVEGGLEAVGLAAGILYRYVKENSGPSEVVLSGPVASEHETRMQPFDRQEILTVEQPAVDELLEKFRF